MKARKYKDYDSPGWLGYSLHIGIHPTFYVRVPASQGLEGMTRRLYHENDELEGPVLNEQGEKVGLVVGGMFFGSSISENEVSTKLLEDAMNVENIERLFNECSKSKGLN